MSGPGVDDARLKEAEEARRASENRYRDLFNSIDAGFCVCQMILDGQGKPVDYRFLEINPRFEEQTGLRKALGRTARELVPDLEEHWFELYGHVALTGEPARFQQGSVPMGRWFDVYAFRTGEPRALTFAILFNDVTERRRLEIERERFLAVGYDLQVINGTDGYFRWVNPAWEKTFGWALDEMTRTPWRDFVHPDDLSGTMVEAEAAYTGKETVFFENRYRCKDGSYRWLSWRARTYPEDGLIYAVAADVTERREADRRKEEFLAMLAHELRNPLAPIRNATQVLKMLGPVDSRQQWAHGVIERQTQHLARLVDDLLDVSRITRGTVTLSRQPLDLADVVHRAVEANRPLIDARRHRLTVTLPAEPVRVDGDLTRLVQAAGNLLNNAAKYTDEGGEIRIEAAREGDEAVLRVADSGMGMSADLLPRVFDLFTQADRSLDRAQGGLGIGLTLVRQLVELHGGHVEAHSAGPGRGSELVIRLPVLACQHAR